MIGVTLKNPVPPEKKQCLEPVLVFEHRTKQRQLNAQINNEQAQDVNAVLLNTN